jgi:phosphoglycerate dehydrogenase-like enzyme
LTRGIALQTKRMVSDGQWGYDGPQQVEINGMTMGIIGIGGIGREVARRAKAMGMTVLAVDAEPYTFQHLGGVVDELAMVDDGLDAMLPRCNVLVSAVPHTPKSRGMLGAAQFAKLPTGAYFINVSRGKIVKTDALVESLKSGHLAGAGLDVTDPEPLPKGHALWSMPNVVITSHIAGKSPQGSQRVRDVFIENVRRCAKGLPLMNVVDKQKGY